jgi:hypothetical protein
MVVDEMGAVIEGVGQIVEASSIRCVSDQTIRVRIPLVTRIPDDYLPSDNIDHENYQSQNPSPNNAPALLY